MNSILDDAPEYLDCFNCHRSVAVMARSGKCHKCGWGYRLQKKLKDGDYEVVWFDPDFRRLSR